MCRDLRNDLFVLEGYACMYQACSIFVVVYFVVEFMLLGFI